MRSQKTWKDKLIGTLKGAGIVSVILLVIAAITTVIGLVIVGSSAAFGRIGVIPMCLTGLMATIIALVSAMIADDYSTDESTKRWVIGFVTFMAIVLGCLLITGLIAYFSGHRILALILDAVCDIFIAGYLLQDLF